ncbi:MAG TPA: response regulator, partial [Planctomycetes bacterium]|nr:response regulator [Planctomycetota bacterium]
MRVLIVDDSAVFRAVLSQCVERVKGLEVAGTARNGMQAIEMVRKDPPDLVLLDIAMPRMDGIATLKEIRKDYPDLGVILVSSANAKGLEGRPDAADLGQFEYIQKPTVTAGESGVETLAPMIERAARALTRAR